MGFSTSKRFIGQSGSLRAYVNLQRWPWKTREQRFPYQGKKSDLYGKKSDPVKKAVQGKKSDFSKKKVKKREKNKMTNFPTKNQKQVAFFTVRFFYPALLAALFFPYMVRRQENDGTLQGTLF
jgi:hypothetical protein